MRKREDVEQELRAAKAWEAALAAVGSIGLDRVCDGTHEAAVVHARRALILVLLRLDPQRWTAREVARLLGCDVSSVYRVRRAAQG